MGGFFPYLFYRELTQSADGYGLGSLQVRLSSTFGDRFELTAAAGWFGSADTHGRESAVGVDLLLMGTYRLHRFLTLDAGVAAARLEDSVSGYFRGALGGFNGPAGEDRDKVALFARLQAEF